METRTHAGGTGPDETAILTAMSKPAVGEKPLRVLIVDDWTAVRRGLHMRLELEPDLEIAGEANDGATAIALTTRLKPDLVLMDLEMPSMDGIEAAATLRAVAPGTAVVVLTLYDDAATRARAKEAGAVALVAKHEVEEQLLATVRRIRDKLHKRKHQPTINRVSASQLTRAPIMPSRRVFGGRRHRSVSSHLFRVLLVLHHLAMPDDAASRPRIGRQLVAPRKA